jgi:hypothetical protein
MTVLKITVENPANSCTAGQLQSWLRLPDDLLNSAGRGSATPALSETTLDQGPRRRPFRPKRPQNAQRPSPTRQGGFRHGNPRQTAANARSRYESYITMARDATSRGDTIEAENLYQHAEHYFRVLREQQE